MCVNYSKIVAPQPLSCRPGTPSLPGVACRFGRAMSKRGGGSGGGSAHIEVFGRIRPSKRPSHYLEVDYADHAITLSIPKSEGGLINNQKERWAFPFSRVLDASTNQETVFEVVARPVIDSVLEGYNGTIFAYGQTGSGKTYTITGGAERYVDRGIIPRAIAYVFQRIGERPDFIFEVRISYLEIYQNSGYDLLDEKHDTKAIEDLPKVSLLEDEEGKTHLRNLSSQLARSEEEALNLLFVGDTNRMISETPMNLASSRSHCIFTVSIDARRPDSEVVRRSKLHLVDLAGSERIKKTGIEGKMLNEAKYINVSLHFLEQVIVALQEKQKFVPYRNSMMTQCLRDSLGGNCRTVMVATLAPEEELIDETISTCRFAQVRSTSLPRPRFSALLLPQIPSHRPRLPAALLPPTPALFDCAARGAHLEPARDQRGS